MSRHPLTPQTHRWIEAKGLVPVAIRGLDGPDERKPSSGGGVDDQVGAVAGGFDQGSVCAVDLTCPLFGGVRGALEVGVSGDQPGEPFRLRHGAEPSLVKRLPQLCPGPLVDDVTELVLRAVTLSLPARCAVPGASSGKRPPS